MLALLLIKSTRKTTLETNWAHLGVSHALMISLYGLKYSRRSSIDDHGKEFLEKMEPLVTQIRQYPTDDYATSLSCIDQEYNLAKFS